MTRHLDRFNIFMVISVLGVLVGLVAIGLLWNLWQVKQGGISTDFEIMRIMVGGLAFWAVLLKIWDMADPILTYAFAVGDNQSVSEWIRLDANPMRVASYKKFIFWFGIPVYVFWIARKREILEIPASYLMWMFGLLIGSVILGECAGWHNRFVQRKSRNTAEHQE